MRVLLVEDEKTSAKLLEHALEPYGTVVSSGTSEDGFDLFMMALEAGEPFDAICLDVELPGLNGIELLDEIRRVEEDMGIVGQAGVKVLVTSAVCDLSTYSDASLAGCTSFLCKPVCPDKLLFELKRLGLVNA